MTNEHMARLDQALAEIDFPRGFLDDFELMECLASGHGTETFIVRKKDAGQLCVGKCFDLKVFQTVKESEILKTLHHEGLPAFIAEYRNDETVLVVREYIAGTPLDKYMASKKLSPARAASIAIQLCDILTYLHTQVPAVIHRDIKPQNVIIRPNGDAALIDFDIARVYELDARTDTQFFGTRVYAPPEQYGFSQTDERTDIYSLGVLLCCMLTGSADVKCARIPDRKLANIVGRCTAFAPDKRFASAADVKRQLLRSGRVGFGRILRSVAICFIALGLVCAGFAIGRYTSFLAVPDGMLFKEPVIEKAVRARLGIDESAPLTREDLLAVDEIYIFGNEVSATEDKFADGLGGAMKGAPRGSVETLDDVKLLPHLKVLYVNYQTLSDISAVAELKHLTYVDFRHTYVEDISPLSGMSNLRKVNLYETRVSDLSYLGACPDLDTLEAGETLITSLDDLPGIPTLEVLSLKRVPLKSIEGIERFKGLRYLYLNGTGIADLTPLKSLPGLTLVSVDESMLGAASALGDVPFEIEVK